MLGTWDKMQGRSAMSQMKSDSLGHVRPGVWYDGYSKEQVSPPLCPHLRQPSCGMSLLVSVLPCSGTALLVWLSPVSGGGNQRLTLVLIRSGTAVTVGTASALGAAPSRCPGPPWGPQVSGAGWGSGSASLF